MKFIKKFINLLIGFSLAVAIFFAAPLAAICFLFGFENLGGFFIIVCILGSFLGPIYHSFEQRL